MRGLFVLALGVLTSVVFGQAPRLAYYRVVDKAAGWNKNLYALHPGTDGLMYTFSLRDDGGTNVESLVRTLTPGGTMTFSHTTNMLFRGACSLSNGNAAYVTASPFELQVRVLTPSLAEASSGLVGMMNGDVTSFSSFENKFAVANLQSGFAWVVGFDTDASAPTWSKQVPNEVSQIAFDSSGNIYCLQSANENLVITKINAGGGSIAWTREVIQTGVEAPRQIAVNDAGEAYILAEWSRPTFTTDNYLVKLNANGTVGWTKRWGRFTNGNDMPVALAVRNTGTGCVVASTGSDPLQTVRGVLFSYGSDGTLHAQRDLQNVNCSVTSMTSDNVGNVYCAVARMSDYVLTKHSPGLNPFGSTIFPYTGAMSSISNVRLDSFNNLIGLFQGGNGQPDSPWPMVAKYTPLQGLTSAGNSVKLGQTVNATLRLTIPAPAGGAHVQLIAAEPTITPTPVVVVPEGQTSATFAITGETVDESVRITARYGGCEIGNTFKVVP
ncbi:MAG TPA: hypothetical protein PKA27_05130 [Fimbriimonadaceae bacterium]|nr:hypothetical protein [Fimbriimonadaceae bacterium]